MLKTVVVVLRIRLARRAIDYRLYALMVIVCVPFVARSTTVLPEWNPGKFSSAEARRVTCACGGMHSSMACSVVACVISISFADVIAF